MKYPFPFPAKPGNNNISAQFPNSVKHGNAKVKIGKILKVVEAGHIFSKKLSLAGHQGNNRIMKRLYFGKIEMKAIAYIVGEI